MSFVIAPEQVAGEIHHHAVGTEPALWAPASSMTIPKLQLLFPAWSRLTVLSQPCSEDVLRRVMGSSWCCLRGMRCDTRGPAHLWEMTVGEVRGQSGWLGLIYYQSFKKKTNKTQTTTKKTLKSKTLTGTQIQAMWLLCPFSLPSPMETYFGIKNREGSAVVPAT